MKKVLIPVIIAVLGISGYFIYKSIWPNVIHGILVCGTVLKDGEAVEGKEATIFGWYGGRRYVLKDGSLRDSGRNDRARFKRQIQIGSDGKFCLERQVTKYRYKLGQFQFHTLEISAVKDLQEKEVEEKSELEKGIDDMRKGRFARKPPPMPDKGGIEGVLVAGKMDQKAQNIKVEVIYELSGDVSEIPRPTEKEVGEAYIYLFNNDARLK